MKNIFASNIYAGGAHPVENSDIDDAISYIESEIIVKSETIPEASENLHKAVYQYVGETDSNFTHGFIYECKKIDNSLITFTPNTITCSGNDFINFLEDVGSGYDYDSVVSGTMEYVQDADLWIFTGKNSEDETVFTYQQYTQDYANAGFTFTGTYEDGDIVAFERTVVYTYEWSRLDVQPDSTDLTNYYTKTETNTLLENKADKATTLSGYGITDAYTKTEVDSSLSGKANVGLDNLNSDGQMIIDSANGTISNCILEIPQNIKLTLENNVLTLKAGSVLVKPASVYTTVTVVNDVSNNISAGTDGLYVQFAIATSSGALQGLILLNNIFSGTEFPTGDLADFTVFFNINEYKFYYYRTNTSSWTEWNLAYPLCLIEIKSGVASFAKDSNGRDMIFNGWCYLGGNNGTQVSFIIYPNIKGLISNGINSNGNLDSVDISRSALTIIGRTSSYNDLCIVLKPSNVINIEVYDYTEYENLSDITNPAELHIYYIKNENKYYRYLSGDYTVRDDLPFIIFDKNSTGVTIKQVRQPYEGARYLLTDEIKKQIGDVETLLAEI